MELVKLVMEIYYNLIRLQELEENNFSSANENEFINNYSSHDDENTHPTQSTHETDVNNLRSPSSYYSSINGKSSELRHFTQNQNDSIYMNNACLNARLTDAKSNSNSNNGNNDNTNKDLKDSIKHMESINLNTHESSTDYINRLIDEINKNGNLSLNSLSSLVFIYILSYRNQRG